MHRINDLSVGYSKEFKVRVTPTSHNKFKTEVKDFSPVHTDDEFAASAGYRKKIAYGFQVLSYLSRLYGHYLPGGSSICLKQEAKFLRPVYVNDVLTIRGEIIFINKQLKLVTVKNQITNQRGEVCVVGEGVVKVVV